jgi:hypothetical protein
VCLEVTVDGHGVANVKTESIVDCPNQSTQFLLTVTITGGAIPINPNLTWSYTYSNSELAGSSISGAFDTAGNVTGTLEIRASFDYNGTHYDCSAAAFAFHAKLGA